MLALDDHEQQDALAHRIVAEGLSVRATEELVALAIADGPAPKKTAPGQRRRQPQSPALHELADRLSDQFDTRVKIDLGRRKGRITIEFGSVDDLERIASVMGVEGRAEKTVVRNAIERVPGAISVTRSICFPRRIVFLRDSERVLSGSVRAGQSKSH